MRLALRQLIALTILILVTTIAFAAGTSGRPICGVYSGWVTDSECGAKGASATHTREHVEEVLARGGQLLFFSEADQKLYPVADPAAAIERVGKRLTVDAHLEIVIHKYTFTPPRVPE